jgi:hypothetical protein
MNEIDYLKDFVLCSGDVAVDIDHLHIKIIHLVSFSYIIIEDKRLVIMCQQQRVYQFNPLVIKAWQSE